MIAPRRPFMASFVPARPFASPLRHHWWGIRGSLRSLHSREIGYSEGRPPATRAAPSLPSRRESRAVMQSLLEQLVMLLDAAPGRDRGGSSLVDDDGDRRRHNPAGQATREHGAGTVLPELRVPRGAHGPGEIARYDRACARMAGLICSDGLSSGYARCGETPRGTRAPFMAATVPPCDMVIEGSGIAHIVGERPDREARAFRHGRERPIRAMPSRPDHLDPDEYTSV